MAKKLGEKIRDLRRANNLSQEALASTLGVTFQAVSKWENSTTMPDVGLIPAIAHFFGVSIDELFDYNTYENEQSIDKLCREAAACRYRDPGHAEALLRDGLKQFPGNETILTVLMFVLQSVPAREEELIETCRQLIDRTTNEGVRYDALRTLAEAYFYTNRADRVGPVLAQIPEFYFTKLECVARLTEGQSSLEAAQFQMNLSGRSLVEMLKIMSDGYGKRQDQEKSALCTRLSQGVLEVFRREGGQALEVPGYLWIDPAPDTDEKPNG
jgi:transcriptional regulator with XRE-family HTH domain